MLERIIIVAGESSAEMYGALLAAEFIRLNPNVLIKGVGGIRMRQAGVVLISEIASSFGITETLKTFLKVRDTFYKVVSEVRTFAPQVVILIDYPDFNIRLAAEIKRFGCKILYFVSPQVWAWRPSRIYQIASHVHKMAAILPFEPEIYYPTGLDCRFVGHPILDELKSILHRHGFGHKSYVDKEVKDYFKSLLKINNRLPCLVLMPGSRRHEVMSLFTTMIKSACRLKVENKDIHLILPIAQNLPDDVKSYLKAQSENYSIALADDAVVSLLAGDLAIIASGTSSLQATFTMTPMVVVYKVSMLTYLIGKLLIKVKHISLTNIILDKLYTDNSLRVKELIQNNVTDNNIYDELYKLANDETYRNEMLRQFETVVGKFKDKSAIIQTVQMAFEMVQ